jgi:hypothetical protein
MGIRVRTSANLIGSLVLEFTRELEADVGCDARDHRQQPPSHTAQASKRQHDCRGVCGICSGSRTQPGTNISSVVERSQRTDRNRDIAGPDGPNRHRRSLPFGVAQPHACHTPGSY